MARLIFGSVGRYSGGTLPRSTVWRGKQHGPVGELGWIVPSVLTVVLFGLTIWRECQMLKGPNPWLALFMLSVLFTLASFGIRLIEFNGQPENGRYIPSGDSKILLQPGEIWLTDEPELNPKIEGSRVVLHEDIVEALSERELLAVVTWLRRRPKWLDAAQVLMSTAGTSPLSFMLIAGWTAPVSFWIAGGILLFYALIGVLLPYRLATKFPDLELDFMPHELQHDLAAAMLKVYELAHEEPNAYTRARVERLAPRLLGESNGRTASEVLA